MKPTPEMDLVPTFSEVMVSGLPGWRESSPDGKDPAVFCLLVIEPVQTGCSRLNWLLLRC